MVLLMRSILVGLVTMFVTSWLILIGMGVWSSRSDSSHSTANAIFIRLDAVSLFHSLRDHPFFFAAMAASFATGFLLGYRRLSRR